MEMRAAVAKSLQSCPTLCDPIDCSPPGFPVPGILQARTLEWVTISFSNAWKWKEKVKSFSSVRLLVTPWTAAYQGFSREEYWSGVPLPPLKHESNLSHFPHLPARSNLYSTFCLYKFAMLPWWLSGKKSACQCNRCGFDPWLKIPWRRKWQPTPVFLPGESHGQRSLVGYRPRGSQKSQVWLSS